METRSTAQSNSGQPSSLRLSELARRAEGHRLPWSMAVELAVRTGHMLQEEWSAGRTPIALEPDALYVHQDLSVHLEAPSDASAGKFSIRRRYQSPEVKNGKPRTETSDVYSLAALLFELLTGSSVLNAVLHSPISTRVPAPSSLHSSVPQALDAVLLQGVEFDQRQRFESLDQFLKPLIALLPPEAERQATRESFLSAIFPEWAPPQQTASKLRAVTPPDRSQTDEVRATALGFEDEGPVLIRPRPTLTLVQQQATVVLSQAPKFPSPSKEPSKLRLSQRLAAFKLPKHPQIRKSFVGVGVGFLVGMLAILWASPPREEGNGASLVTLASKVRLLDASLSIDEFRPLPENAASEAPVERRRKQRDDLPWLLPRKER